MTQNLIEQIQQFVIGHLGFLGPIPIEVWYIGFVFAFGGAILGGAMFFAGVASYAERKLAGHIQSRMGPMRVGPHGIFQFMADGLKLVLKEDLIPAAADKLLFRLAPYILFAGTIAAFAAIPFSRAFGVTNLNIGLLYIIAVTSLGVVGIIMTGWASGNKWNLLGALRSAAQIVSYEIPIGVSFLVIIMMASTLNLFSIVEQQAGGILGWFVFRYPPFTMFAFLVYFIASVAEVNRTPFDIPEAESEIVAGYHTEYSGMRFAIFFMSEYANVLLVSLIASVLFLGGWQSPLPFQILPGDWFILEGLGWLLAKSLCLVFLQMWLRWTVPRLRVDQLMQLCWKVLVPVAFGNMIAIGIWLVL